MRLLLLLAVSQSVHAWNPQAAPSSRIQDDAAKRPPKTVPPMLRSSTDPISPPFTSWEVLLQQTTRSGKQLKDIPSFVSFCLHHAQVGKRWTGEKDHIPGQLQGGASAGPLSKTGTHGQVVRAGAAFAGLTTHPRHSIDTAVFRHGDLRWVHELERQLPVIRNEVQAALKNEDDLPWQSLRTRKGSDWSDETGWGHLAAIDNFRVYSDVVDLFPATMQAVHRAIGPRIGPRLVAIARQRANSGIPDHYDYMNWMLTLHLPIQGPASGGGMVVDGVKQDWLPGQPVVMDTTFQHSTYNDSNQDMYALLVDFWHPDLSFDEIDALRAFLAANSGV